MYSTESIGMTGILQFNLQIFNLFQKEDDCLMTDNKVHTSQRLKRIKLT